MDAPPLQTQKPEPIGPTVAIVIIILVFVLGGIYFFFRTQMQEESLPPENMPAEGTPPQEIEQVNS